MAEIDGTGAGIVHVANLIKLGAQTALDLGGAVADGKLSRLTEVITRIEVAATELAEIGQELQGGF